MPGIEPGSPDQQSIPLPLRHCDAMSNEIKVEINLYFVKANSYTKFQENTPIDNIETFNKSNNSSKTRFNPSNAKFIYTKFQVDISKDDREKFGKPNCRCSDG